MAQKSSGINGAPMEQKSCSEKISSETDLDLCNTVLKVPSSLPPLRYALHSNLSSLHATHGLYPLLASSSPSGDGSGPGGSSSSLAAYRQYLTRKMRRLRHSHPNIRREHGHGRGRGTFVQRDRVVNGVVNPPACLLDYCTRSAAEAENGAVHSRDPLPPGLRHLLLATMRAERAWAHAGEVRSAPLRVKKGARPRGRSAGTERSKRGHVLRLLRRAAGFASELEAMASLCGDSVSALECAGYARWASANLAVERNRWEEAVKGYARAAEILEVLAAANGGGVAGLLPSGSSEEDEASAIAAVSGLTLQEQDVFETRLASIRPMLAYCRHELMRSSGEEAQLTVANASVLTGDDLDVALEHAIVFRGRTVDPRSVPGLAESITQAEESAAKEKTGNHDDHVYLNALGAYDDALRAVKTETNRLKGAASGSKVTARRDDLAALEGHVRFAKLTTSLVRTERMVDAILTTDKRQCDVGAAAHMYDFLWQTSQEVLALPHPDHEEGSTTIQSNTVDDDFYAENEAHVLRYRAFRAYYVGRMYADEGKFQHATVLYDHSQALSAQAIEQLTACEMDDNLIDSLNDLRQDVTGALCRARASPFLSTGSNFQSPNDSNALSYHPTILTRLYDYEPGPTQMTKGKYALAETTPQVKPMPCKPTFFDMAANYLDPPDLGRYVKQEEEKREARAHADANAGRGLLGWFRRG